jgi:hypothetical protein
MALSEFPSFEVQFTKEGEVHNRKEVEEGLKLLEERGVTDLIVISHGWNNDMSQARSLYERFFDAFRKALGSAPDGVSSRTFGVMAVLWPSKKFAETELIPSGAAGARSAVTDDAVKAEIDELIEALDDEDATASLRKAKELVVHLDDKRSARDEFANLVRSVLDERALDKEDAPKDLKNLPGEQVMQRLSKPVLPPPGEVRSSGEAASTGGPKGTAASVGGLFSGMKASALKLVNTVTYYKMKERAGTVGSGGVFETLKQIKGALPNLKLHLIGHSFGGRLVTAATAGPEGQQAIGVDSLALLQAAFSHHGFAQKFDGKNDGFFRSVIAEKKVRGPILVTCTKNDRAVGLAYPIASLAAGQVAASLGDKNDPYGGIGRNGAQKTPEAINGELLVMGGSYRFQGMGLYNLTADSFIRDHSDIAKPEVAQAVISAIATT